MKQNKVDIAIIGAGPAGLAAAISAREHGAKNIVVFDRNNWVGGILPQCIHDGFGVEETGQSMTGTEYSEMYIKKALEKKITIKTETMVLDIRKNKDLTILNRDGLQFYHAKCIVLAMGCRERTRWNIRIPGTRPSGIYTAGVAQGFINLYNIMPGENVVVLGSGDVGLIMARRMKLEGAKVHAVAEILPYPSGLPRNIVQCLDDYDIPLYLNHTVTCIQGKDRVEEITIAQVDEHKKIKPNSEKKFKCDTLLLSVGLIPENELSKKIDIQLDIATGGPFVNQFFETNIRNVFACGNCLQVYDTVDALSFDAKKAGRYAAKQSKGKKTNIRKSKKIRIDASPGIKHVIPHMVDTPGDISMSLRVVEPGESKKIYVKADDKIIFQKKYRFLNPANMISFSFKLENTIYEKTKNIEVSIDD